MQKLFEAFPHGTLAMLATGAGFIAVFTLLLEVATGQFLAKALGLPLPFLSMPLGLATVILAGLTARGRAVYAFPSLIFGVAYWAIFFLTLR